MGAAMLVLLLVLGGGCYLYLLSSLPHIDGRLVVPGAKGEIRIERDADGVPLITARDDEDTAFGLGFAHAQERLFQMELQRRYGAGRLAEILGPEAVATDRQMRVLGLYRAAEDQRQDERSGQEAVDQRGIAPAWVQGLRGVNRPPHPAPGRAPLRLANPTQPSPPMGEREG